MSDDLLLKFTTLQEDIEAIIGSYFLDCKDFSKYAPPCAKKILAKAKQHKNGGFRRALEQSRKGEPLDLSEEDFELFSAIQTDGAIKAKQHYEQKDSPIEPLGFNPEFPPDFPEQKRLDRPDREKVSSIIYETLGEDTTFNKEGGYFPNQDLSDEIADRILALLIPDMEELDKIRGEIARLNKKLDDREEDLIEAKREEGERILGLLPEIPKRFDHNKTCFDCVERIKRQALKELEEG